MPETPPAAVPGGAQPNQPPFGQTPATGPTPNRGYEAAGLQRLGAIVKNLEEILPMFGAASEHGQGVLKALNILVKMVPAGSVTPAAQKNNVEQMALSNARNNQQLQALQQSRAPQQPQGGQAA